MAVFIMPAPLMHPRLGSREVDPDDSRPPEVRQRQIRLAVPVEIGHPAALRLDRVRDEMLWPRRAQLLRILVPPESVPHPAQRDHVRRSIVIDVDRPLAAIRNEFANCLDCPILMPLPLPALRPRVLIPVGSA